LVVFTYLFTDPSVPSAILCSCEPKPVNWFKLEIQVGKTNQKSIKSDYGKYFIILTGDESSQLEIKPKLLGQGIQVGGNRFSL
jgi:hypothetical protein